MDQGREKNGPVRHVNKMDFCSTTSFPITMSFHLSLPTTRPHSEIYIFGAVQFRTSLFASFDCFLLSRPREIYEIQEKKRKEIGKSLPSSYDFRRRPFRSRVRRVSSTSSHSRGFISGLKAVGTKGHPMILTRL